MVKFLESKRNVSDIESKAVIPLDEISKAIPYPYDLEPLEQSAGDFKVRLNELEIFLTGSNQGEKSEDYELTKRSLINSLRSELDTTLQLVTRDLRKLEGDAPIGREQTELALKDIQNDSGDISAVSALRDIFNRYFGEVIDELSRRVKFYERLFKIMHSPHNTLIKCDMGDVTVEIERVISFSNEKDQKEYALAIKKSEVIIQNAIYDIMDKQHKVKLALKGVLTRGFGSGTEMRKSITVNQFYDARKDLNSFWKVNIEETQGIEKCLFDIDKLCKWVNGDIFPMIDAVDKEIIRHEDILMIDSGEDKVSYLKSKYGVIEFLKQTA